MTGGGIGVLPSARGRGTGVGAGAPTPAGRASVTGMGCGGAEGGAEPARPQTSHASTAASTTTVPMAMARQGGPSRRSAMPKPPSWAFRPGTGLRSRSASAFFSASRM
jgi:hypothetical protein